MPDCWVTPARIYTKLSNNKVENSIPSPLGGDETIGNRGCLPSQFFISIDYGYCLPHGLNSHRNYT